MANKQKRITLKTIHQMLDGMSVELAEKVHLLRGLPRLVIL